MSMICEACESVNIKCFLISIVCVACECLKRSFNAKRVAKN